MPMIQVVRTEQRLSRVYTGRQGLIMVRIETAEGTQRFATNRAFRPLRSVLEAALQWATAEGPSASLTYEEWEALGEPVEDAGL